MGFWVLLNGLVACSARVEGFVREINKKINASSALHVFLGFDRKFSSYWLGAIEPA